MAGDGGAALDELCPRLARGFGRIYFLSILPTGLLENGRLDCNPVFDNDDDALAWQFGSVDELTGYMCTDGGGLQRTVEDIAASQRAGRALYVSSAADICTISGRAAINDVGGLAAAVAASVSDGGFPFTEAASECLRAIVGMQDEGEACNRDIECAQGDAGAECVARRGEGCTGVCRRFRVAGERCDDVPDVSCEDSSCVDGVCETPRAQNDRCVTDAGSTTDCEDPFDCIDGICAQRATVGESCFYSGQCRPELWCEPVTSTCQSRGGEGEVCELGPTNRSCQPCLTCFPGHGPDAGPPRCRTLASLDDSCADRPCHLGLACASGTCVGLARTGEPCVAVDDADPSMRGNCLSATQACLGSPSTCQPRARAGAACTARAGTLPTTGSCRTDLYGEDLWCLRPRSTDIAGICTPPGAPGTECGYRSNLTPECEANGEANARCTAFTDGSVGTCVYSSGAPRGGICLQNTDCETGDYCSAPGDGGTGVCTPAGAPGEACGSGTEWGTRCQQGLCAPSADAGGALRCVGFKETGETCNVSSDCGPDGRCARPDGSFESICGPRLTEGSGCSTDNDCLAGLACYAGICVNAVCASAQENASCADGGGIPVLLLFGAMIAGARWRRRREG